MKLSVSVHVCGRIESGAFIPDEDADDSVPAEVAANAIRDDGWILEDAKIVLRTGLDITQQLSTAQYEALVEQATETVNSASFWGD